MKRVFVAGAYSSDHVLKVLDNMRKGQRLGLEVLMAGYAPFVPWFDYHFQLMLRDDEQLDINNYYSYTQEWLKASDAMLVLPGFQDSTGTLEEIKIATLLNIPIFYSMDDLKKNLERT